MIKRYIGIFLLLFFSLTNFVYGVASGGPGVHCEGLPGCEEGKNVGLSFVSNLISEFIKFIAVMSVFAVIFSGIMYLLSAGDEEKTKKAKNWIIYSLIGVFISVSAWGIIDLLNNLRIG